jgi:signal transduction histidine kinase/DNA-binding response OmpR family regulator/HAMP domain-containing protein
MKLHDMTIGMQLAIGLGLILAFVILLGIVSYNQEESLWLETKGLYDHPLQVRRAIAEVGIEVLTMHRDMKDLVLAENESEWVYIIQEIDVSEKNAEKSFDILYDRYLGPKSDLDTLYVNFISWKSIREETIRLLREGRTDEAIDRVKPFGDGGLHVTLIMDNIKVISDYAMQRGDQYYWSADQHKNALILQLGFLIGIILFLSLCISYLLIRGIRGPVRELTQASEDYQKGRFDARSRYVSTNEFGLLSSSFNSLVETVQFEMQSRENVARISEVMLKEEELIPFSRELLQSLLQYTDSQVAAIYLLNTEKTDYTLFDSIGLCPFCRTSFSATVFEGEFGNSLATGKIQRITAIPEDSPFVLFTVSGDIRPREILTIPISGAKEIIAMISLASVHDYTPQAIRLIHDISDILIARFNGVVAYSKNREFSEILEGQNRELTSQSRELMSQTHELKEQNIELEVQKKQLDEANRLKSVFLSNMSHELRTPLNSVIALSGVLLRRLRGSVPDDEYSYLTVIERNGRLLLSLINDILDIARIEAGREDVNISSFSVQDLIITVLDSVQPQADEKNIILNNTVDESIPQITCDFLKCQHILQNIIANAVKFTEQGSVTISARVTDSILSITVEDTGIGIDEEMLPYIFDEFRQADERIGRMYGGSGLGLSIAKKYATLLGGSITVSSTPGSGSVFTLHLPLMISSESSDETMSPCVIQQYSSNHIPSEVSGEIKSILLVEDNEPAIIQIQDLLTEQGYLVRIARDGNEAILKVNESLPDAMILDLMMPEVDGFTVLHMIRSQKKTAQLPVLILTAKHITKEELAFLQGNHIHQLIQKGDISKSGLLSAVKNMVYVSHKTEDIGVEKKSALRVTHEKPKILIVEDNPDNMTTARAILSNVATVIEATNGQEGIEKTRSDVPDLIFLDISLPLMDGFEVLNTLKADESLKHIPVIALTARAMKGDRKEILSRGFDGYISKPIDEELLKQTIGRVLYGQ